MRLEVRGVDHDPLGLGPFARQLGEDPVEHAHAAPAHETVVNRLVRAVTYGRVAPAQSFLMTKTIALTICRSSTRAIPCDNGK